MKTNRPFVLTALVMLALSLAGCGPSQAELEARERARFEHERQAQEEAAKANKAITDMNKSMFSRMNASRTGGTTPDKPAEPAADSPPPETSEPKQP